MILLWVLAALLCLGVVAMLALPLLSRRAAVGMDHPDLAVYRDQLAELEREVARGLLPETEAASARLEIERRLLAAAGPAGVIAKGGRGAGRAWLGAGLLLLLLPAATVAIYLDVGSPGLPAFPFADRTAPPAPAGNQQMAAATAQLEAAMKAHPEDPKGWALLAGSEGQLGRYAEAAAAYGKSIALLQAAHQPVAAILPSLQGEALTAAAEGQVTPAAKAAFEAALAIDPKDPRARFYLALGESQAGHLDAALGAWVALESDSPADAPWRPMVAAEIEETAKKLGRDPATLPGRKPAPSAPAATAAGNGAAAPNETAPGPSAEDIAKAAAMTPEQRAAFIDSMVKGLADRQKAHPEDIDGWLRLANAYDKLGRADDAFTAWHEAATRAPDRLDTQIAYAAAGAVRAERGAPPADFEATVARLRQLAPDNPLGLYCAGLIAEAHGDKTAAKSFWQKLLPVLPEGSPQRQQIEARIAKLGN
ncbi:MAG: c-type cytochrome biogenesis protein CcmI [Dongiales bacterium]